LKKILKNLGKNQKKTLITEAVIAAALIIFDWLTKLIVFSVVGDDGLTVIDGFLRLEKGLNDGIAFGMFSGYSRLFGVFSIVVSAAVAVYLLKAADENKYMRLGLVLIFAGGVANGAERLIYGFVRDFLYVPFYSNFNVADSCVVVGAAVVMIYMLFFYSKDEKKRREESGISEPADPSAELSASRQGDAGEGTEQSINGGIELPKKQVEPPLDDADLPS
jgi:signal peptidase II